MQFTSSHNDVQSAFIPPTSSPDTDPVVDGNFHLVENEDQLAKPQQDPLVSTSGAENLESVLQSPTLKLKFIRPGKRVKNPRTHFDPAKMAELTETVKRWGIIQAILVRPISNGLYEIVAGERRYRAAMEAHGEEFDMPVLVREMTDEEAEAFGNIENTHRANMSRTEEAAGAARTLGRVKGDRDEAALILGVSRSKLDRLLALMNCSPAVQKALNEELIKLGHAELLAGLAKDKQDVLLPIILKEGTPVPVLKANIEKAAARLETAIFDKTDCNGCAHNSTQQQNMFEESVIDGCCTNSACFKQKTEAVLEAKADELKTDYPVIRILRVGDNETRVKLTASGPKGVGEEQAAACRACASFGAAVSGLPQAMGEVYRDQCFDTECNSKKVQERIKSEKAATEPPKATSAATSKPSVAKTATSTTKPTAKVTTEVKVGDRIKAYREKVWRQAMKVEIAKSPEQSVRYLVALCLNGGSRHINAVALGKAYAKVTKSQSSTHLDLTKCLTAVSVIDGDAEKSMVTLLAASAMGDIEVNKLQQMARFHGLDLTKHWKLDAELLGLLTKSEMEVLAKEIGLTAALGEKAKKLFSEKVPDLIKGLLSVDGFNYSGKIPSFLNY